MTTHIFLGAGPANLDRALRILYKSPNDKLIIIDNRIHKSGYFKGGNLRANILLLDYNYVLELMAFGVDQSIIESKGIWRETNEKNGFNEFDRMVLPNKSGLQISIGNLQNILIKTIGSRSKRDHLTMIRTSLINDPYDATELLNKLLGTAGVNQSTDDIEIHIASGSFGKKTSPKDLMIYPPRSKYEYSEASADLRYMFVEQTHGAVTFRLNPFEINTALLADNIRPLDETKWQDELSSLGWNLFRPPQVRLFYTHDHLYLGMEIPASWEALYIKDKIAYQNQLIDYGRRIAKLMILIQSDKLDALEANRSGVNAPSFFKTNRGEAGIVAKSLRDGRVSLFIHGDARYLPHYQSSSGIIIASDINQLWINIRSQTFDDLIKWGINMRYIRYEYVESRDKSHPSERYIVHQKELSPEDINNIKNRYIHPFQDNSQSLTKDEIEKRALQAFRIELYIYASHKLIDSNKDKVQTYFKNLITQSLYALTDKRFFEIISAHINMPDAYLKHLNDIPSNALRLDNQIKKARFIEMLVHLDIELLKTILPEIINFDFSGSLDNHAFLDRMRQSIFDSRKGITVQIGNRWNNDEDPIHNHVYHILIQYPAFKTLVLNMLLESSYFESNPIPTNSVSSTFIIYRSIGKEEQLFNKLLDYDNQLDSIIPDFRAFNYFCLIDVHSLIDISKRFDKRLFKWLLSSESRFSRILSSQNLIIEFLRTINFHSQTNLFLDLLCENESLIHHFLPEAYALDEYKTIITGKERTVLSYHLRDPQRLYKSQLFFELMIKYGAKENIGLFFNYTVRNQNRGFEIDDIMNSDRVLNTQNLEILEALLIWFVDEKVKSSDLNYNIIFHPLAFILTRLKDYGSKKLDHARPLFEKVFATKDKQDPYEYSKYKELFSKYYQKPNRLSDNTNAMWQNPKDKRPPENGSPVNESSP